MRQVLGDDTPDDSVARIVRHADGNAFYLEELVRALAEGSASLPDTVLATVQARLDARESTSPVRSRRLAPAVS